MSRQQGSRPPRRRGGTADDIVRADLVGQVGIITLEDRRKRNAIGAQLAGGVIAALESLRADQARAVVLRAAEGMDVWSAGHDISELPRAAGTRWATTIPWKD